MKYTYAYKTSDGTRHEATMEAESREAVFAALRMRGIKAIKVVAADGSKANGEVRGVRKRIVALIALAAAIVVGVVAFILGESNNQTIEQSNNALSSPRHQIYGDPAIVESFERGNFSSVFTNEADRMLAWFAQPGKLMCPRGTDPRRLAAAFARAYQAASGASSTASRPSHDASLLSREHSAECSRETVNDSREVRELKQIVNGMRDELREYLANGNGTPRSYWRRLLERTQQEMQIYARIRRELENEKNPAVWEEKNEALRRLGLRTIVDTRTEE